VMVRDGEKPQKQNGVTTGRKNVNWSALKGTSPITNTKELEGKKGKGQAGQRKAKNGSLELHETRSKENRKQVKNLGIRMVPSREEKKA